MARPGRHGLTDDQWSRLRGLLPREKDRSGAPAKISNRQVVHASLWILKTGAPWRDLPRHMGKWNSIYRRYRRWCLNGVWDEVLSDLSKASDDEWHSLDGTIVRAHQDASGGAGGAEQNAIGKSRGGRTTKIHARVDALGHLLAYVVTGGQVHDSQQALPLLNGARSCAFIMDKAYDSDVIRDELDEMNAVAVIPPRSNRNVQFDYDRHLYKERHAVENFFQRIKRYRKLATRYAKRIELYRGAIALVAVMDWLR